MKRTSSIYTIIFYIFIIELIITRKNTIKKMKASKHVDSIVRYIKDCQINFIY